MVAVLGFTGEYSRLTADEDLQKEAEQDDLPCLNILRFPVALGISVGKISRRCKWGVALWSDDSSIPALIPTPQ